MLYASGFDGTKIEATQGGRAVCPSCGDKVIAKCGEINAWHWAHESVAECDPWYEPMTAWHMMWQGIVKPQFCEVVMPPHRADIVGNDDLVIELQASPISVETIMERESFYHMIWLFDVRKCLERIRLRPHESYCSFRWFHPRRSLAWVTAPLFLDLGISIFKVEKIHNDDGPFCGWGNLWTYDRFIEEHLSSVVRGTP